jgi:hypothetical protein
VTAFVLGRPGLALGALGGGKRGGSSPMMSTAFVLLKKSTVNQLQAFREE